MLALDDGATDGDLRRVAKAALDGDDQPTAATVERLVVAVERTADALERVADLLLELVPVLLRRG